MNESEAHDAMGPWAEAAARDGLEPYPRHVDVKIWGMHVGRLNVSFKPGVSEEQRLRFLMQLAEIVGDLADEL